MDNLIDFDVPATTLHKVRDNRQGYSDVLSPQHLSSSLSEPNAPTKTSSHHHQEENESDATGSADSENDMDPPSTMWELRRSSSSSLHSSEDADAEALERREFMKMYVEKVFHGR